MEAVVVGAVVGASIQVLVQNLLTISQERISRDLKKDFEKLKKSFLMVCDFLYDAETRQVNDRAVKRWLRDLEALAFDADNVLDEINYQLLSKKANDTTGDKMTKKVQSFFSPSKNPIANRLRMSHKIRDINKMLELRNQEAAGFGLHMRLAGARDPVSGSDASASIETDSFTVDPIILGRENDVSIIVKMLTTTPAEQTLISVLPIVGMGGLGKTTLARLVFGHAKIKTHFETRVWVHVPKRFDVVVLLKNILTSLTTENVELVNREALLKKLQNSLGAKRYLLVLDDIWNEESDKWYSFLQSLLGISYAAGNCMIVTTRSQEVASSVQTTLPIHELKSLSEDDCWSIIKAKALRGGDNNPLEFETIGTNIAERCKGLPLAAKVVGGLLFGKSKDVWLSIGKNWVSNFGDGDPILKILKLSFDNLSQPSLKKCFAYCSIFPKGFEIEKELLIELWVAEGLLQTDQRSITVETIGNNFFNLLLQNSLLQATERDYYGNVTHCNMHDLVHDLACSVLGENDSEVMEYRYMGYKSIGDVTCSIRKEQAKCLRTLFFSDEVYDICRFFDFKSLHTLTLVGKDIYELPTSVGDLIHLRYLDISGTRIRGLPDSIGKLYHLQTLRAKKERKWEMSYLEYLPNSLKYSISLRNLHIPYHTTLPPEIGRLSSLQTLPHFCVGHEKGCGISELGSLKGLKGKLEIRNLEKVGDKNEAMSADLSQKHCIYKLKLKWDPFGKGEANDESVLEGLQPHPNLKSLEIFGYKGKSLPLWTSNTGGLNNLMKIMLGNCSECEQLPMLGHLPHLRSLYVSNMRNVGSIRSSFYGNISNNGVSSLYVFRALEKLELLDMSNLTEWEEVDLAPPSGGDQTREAVVFPLLKHLKIKRCAQLISAPSHFTCLEKLEISNMKSSLPLENICGVKLTSLKDVSISQIEGLECLPDGLFSNNPNLSSLRIYDCPKMTRLVPCLLGGGGSPSLKLLWISSCLSLRELPDDLHSLNSLEELHIYKCPELMSMPYPSTGGGGGFTSLRRLEIKNCHGMFDLPVGMVESRASSLETLSLIGLSSLLYFPKVIGCLDRMRRLTSLGIHQVPRFSINSALECRDLYYLQMGPFSDSRDYGIFKETLNAVLQPSQLTSLRNLELYGVEQWDRLPDQLQHLTSLSELTLYDFGIVELPEWFENLSSLTVLGVSKCKRLRRLLSKYAMQRLTKLTHLDISDCPLLLLDEACRRVSHINVRVDGIPILLNVSMVPI